MSNASIASELDPIECKMAIAGLRLSRRETAKMAGLSTDTLQRFLRHERVRDITRAKLRTALERNGAIFDRSEGIWVRIKPQQ